MEVVLPVPVVPVVVVLPVLLLLPKVLLPKLLLPKPLPPNGELPEFAGWPLTPLFPVLPPGIIG